MGSVQACWGGGGARGRGGAGDARVGSGGTVWRWVEPAGRLTVVSRTSRRGGEENLPTPGAGSRHNLGRMSERIGLLPCPLPLFPMDAPTGSAQTDPIVRSVLAVGSPNAGLSLPSRPTTARSPRVNNSLSASLHRHRVCCRAGDKNWPAGQSVLITRVRFQISSETGTTKRARGVHTDTVTRSSWPISRSDTRMGPPMRFCTAWCVRGLPANPSFARRNALSESHR